MAARTLLAERPLLIAPEAFGDGLRATAVAGAIGRGIERAGLMPPDLCPVAGGGRGTLEVLVTALGGETAADHALLEDGGTALVEARGTGTGAALANAARSGAPVLLLAAAGAGAGDIPRELDRAGGIGGARLVVLGPGELADALAATHGALVEAGARWVLDALDFDRRMRASRAVVTGTALLSEQSLLTGVIFDLATRARQGGVPLHAIVGEDALDAFPKRIVDLQHIGEGGSPAAIEAAAEELALRIQAA